MWFGVAPPSPARVHSKDWHPPLCSCSKHHLEREKRLEAERQQALLSPHKSTATHRHAHSPALLAGPLSSRQPRAPLGDKVSAVLSPSPRMLVATRTAARTGHSMQTSHPIAGRTTKTTPRQQCKQEPRDGACYWETSARRQLRGVRLGAASDCVKGHSLQPEHAEDEVLDPHDSAEVLLNLIEECELSIPRASDEQHEARRGKECEVRSAGETATQAPNYPRTKAGALPSIALNQEDQTSLLVTLPVPKSRRSSRHYIKRPPEVINDHDTSNNPSNEWSMVLPSPVALRPEHLVGHASSVCALVAHDDRFIVSCSIDGSVKVWSQITFACLHTLYGHEDVVSCVDLSARWLVSGSHDATLRVYRCVDSNLKLLHILTGHSAHVTQVKLPAALPAYVLSCSDDTTLRVWNAELGQCVAVLRAHTSRVTCFALQPGRICSGAADAVICFWDICSLGLNKTQACRAQQLSCAKSFHVHSTTVQCIVAVSSGKQNTQSGSATASSATSSLIASGSNDGTIQLFNASTFDHLGQLDSIGSPVYTMVPLTGGRLLCSTKDGRLLLFGDLSRLQTQKPPAVLQLASKWISALELRGDLVACSCEEVLYVVDTARLSVVLVFETQHSFITCARWIHSRSLITAGQDNIIKLWTIA